MWSRKYEKCVKCGTTEVKHIAKGHCAKCYYKFIENKHKEKNRRRGVASRILTKEYLITEYLNEHKSLSEIARKANCSRQYVHKKLSSYNIPLRTKTEARDLALKRSKLKLERMDEKGEITTVTLQSISVNEDFFSSWSDEMAYVLGVVYTDGNLDPGRIKDPTRKTTLRVARLTISQKELELLNKVLALMNSDAKLYHRKRRKYGNTVSGEVYLFHINSNKIYDDLAKLGLTANKSLTVDFPEIPPEYRRHFIRGCWDGDGGIGYRKSTNRFVASFTSGSRIFIEKMVAELTKAGLKERTIYIHQRKTPSYYILYSGFLCAKLYEYLYKDVAPELYLKRKNDIFLKAYERYIGNNLCLF